MLRRITAAVLCLVFCVGTALADTGENTGDRARVMVLPLDVTAGGDFGYLADSVRAMLSSRLAAKKEVKLVEYGVNAEELKMLNSGGAQLVEGESLFSRFNTDYFVTGAMYALSTGLKLQVVVTGSDQEQGPVRLNVLAVSEDEIISAVEELADEVAGKALGLQLAEIPAAADAAPGDEGLAGFTTEHPERKYKKGIYSGAIVAEDGQKASVKALGIRRSSPIPSMIVSMDTGDVDGDGLMEIVTVSRTSLAVFQFNETRFAKLADYDFKKTYKMHAVNLADFNGDGRMEIYVSGNYRDRAASSIFTWDKSSGLHQKAADIPWYLRPVDKPGSGMILAGQKSSRDVERGFVRGPITKLVVYPGLNGVREEATLPLPRNTRLFDFTWVDLEGDGLHELAAVDQREKLLVYDSSNSLIWVSELDYGGSRNFFGPAISDAYDNRTLVGDDQKQFDRLMVYIPTRIVAADVDRDGKQEIIIGRNNRRYGKWLNTVREYDGGSILCLGWDGSGFNEKWHTNKINGYVADYMVVKGSKTLENDESAKASIYVAQVPERMMFGFAFSRESKLLRYDLDIRRSE